MRLCMASNNRHKLEEVRHALGKKFELVSLEEIGCFEELEETRDTLEGNSLQKAEHVFKNYRLSCFADDTGLEVEALGGAPGVFSARYAGDHKNSEDNIRLLLKNLEGKANRRAQFRAVITLMDSKGVHQFEGIVKGEILTERRGVGGFGYDPVFLPHGFFKTLAEMSMEEKNAISHRAVAVRKLTDFLNKNYE